jgi:hypothetical protein
MYSTFKNANIYVLLLYIPDLFFRMYYDLGSLGTVPRAPTWKGYYRRNKLKMTTSNVFYNTVTKKLNDSGTTQWAPVHVAIAV